MQPATIQGSPGTGADRVPRGFTARFLLLSFLLTLAALIFFGYLADEVFEGHTVRFDAAVRNAVHAHASPALTSVMRALSFVGSAPVIGMAALLLILLFVFVIRWPRAAALLSASLLGDVALETVLKHFFRRARPESFFGYPLPDSYSFPSGHAMASVCFFVVLGGLVAHRIPNRGVKVAFWAIGIAMAAGIGLSRIYLGVHYPTDVLAGYAAATVWVGAILAVDGWRQRRD